MRKLCDVYDEIFAGFKHDETEYWQPLDFLLFIAKWDFIESLPNFTLSLKLFLTICVSVASSEQSFSKLNLIKSYLRSAMGQ